MVQEKVGQTQSYCQAAQTPAKGRGYTALCQSAPILKDVFTWKSENPMTEEQQTRQKREMAGKPERAQSFLAGRRSGRRNTRTSCRGGEAFRETARAAE